MNGLVLCLAMVVGQQDVDPPMPLAEETVTGKFFSITPHGVRFFVTYTADVDPKNDKVTLSKVSAALVDPPAPPVPPAPPAPAPTPTPLPPAPIPQPVPCYQPCQVVYVQQCGGYEGRHRGLIWCVFHPFKTIFGW